MSLQYLAAANGYGKPVHLAPIVLRNSWTCDFSLAGHRSAVSVAKFCPKFLKRKGETGEDEVRGLLQGRGQGGLEAQENSWGR